MITILDIALVPPMRDIAGILLDVGAKSVAVLAVAGVALLCMRRRSASAWYMVCFRPVASLPLLPLLSYPSESSPGTPHNGLVPRRIARMAGRCFAGADSACSWRIEPASSAAVGPARNRALLVRYARPIVDTPRLQPPRRLVESRTAPHAHDPGRAAPQSPAPRRILRVAA